MNKAIICSPEEMNRLQYIEESRMTFEERLRLAFNMLELSKALASKDEVDFADDSDIEWITLPMKNDRGL
jgi:hypothetical protein